MFKKIFEETLNEFINEPNYEESELVKFSIRLRKQKKTNKFIEIPDVGSEYDGDSLFIEFNGKIYSWFITDNKSKNEHILKSRDQFSKYDRCVDDLIRTLKSVSEALHGGGFGRDLEEIEINEELYHSATWEGLDELLNHYNGGDICCSMKSGSKRLFGRELCLVFKKEKRKVEHTSFDADAGKYYGYDEVRVNFRTKQNLRRSIKEIVVPKGTIDYIENLEEDEDDAWKWNILEDFYRFFEESDDRFYNF